MSLIEVTEKLELHRKYLAGEEGGKRLDLRDTDLRGIDFGLANLRGVDLRGVRMNEINKKLARAGGARVSGDEESKAGEREIGMKLRLIKSDVGEGEHNFDRITNINREKRDKLKERRQLANEKVKQNIGVGKNK